jgi:hypothetical protein
MQATCQPDSKQATVILTITDATPGTISALLADPRTDSAGRDEDNAPRPYLCSIFALA